MTETSPKSPLTYADAGVSIEEGDAFVNKIKALAASTKRPGASPALGGFAAALDLKETVFTDPILLATTDGVGTKVKVAIETGVLNTIGIDLVAMCVNDLLAQGAEPLIFLDYYATGALNAESSVAIVEGIAAGCRQAGCALVGGETAEMPGLYAGKDFDLAGFALGAAQRGWLLPRHDVMREGDALIGVGSSGPHSNGYSLIRKIVAQSGLSWSDPAPFAPGLTMGEAFLTPTKIYIDSLLPLVRDDMIKGLAHITGGGLIENPPRMMPKHLTCAFNWNAWDMPPIFQWLMETGPVDIHEMRRAFNCGIGMVAVVGADDAYSIVGSLEAQGHDAWVIGKVVAA